MAIKKTFQIGSEPIRSRSAAVENVSSKKIQRIVRDLVDTMRYENLVSMAAPQIGERQRIFVSEIRTTTIKKKLPEDKLRIFINPHIVSNSKSEVDGYEGCGSVGLANLFGPVKRFREVTVKALDGRGKSFELKATGLLARIIQHEIDHLNGTVFIDKVKNTQQLLGREEYMKLKK